MTSQENILGIVRSALAHLPKVAEKKMFGKIAFMVNDKLCIAVGKEEILCRINPALQDASLLEGGCKPVVMKGKERKGYMYVKNSYLLEKKAISFWINLCLEFNKTIT